MTDNDDKHPQPDNVIRFPVEAVKRFGFKRADHKTDTRTDKMELEGQLSLFVGAPEADDAPDEAVVVPLPLQLSPFEEALLLDNSGDDRAENIYLKAIENDDRAADAWCNLGVLRSIAGDHDTAFDCFAQSIAMDPHHSESHYNIANLYFEIGDLRVARTHYEIALDTYPDFSNAWFNYGLVTALSEEYQTAFDALTRYKELTPEADTDGIADELLGYIQTAINLT